MARKQFTEEQIIATLMPAEAGMPVGEVCRRMGVSEQSFYRWKRKYAGLASPEELLPRYAVGILVGQLTEGSFSDVWRR